MFNWTWEVFWLFLWLQLFLSILDLTEYFINEVIWCSWFCKRFIKWTLHRAASRPGTKFICIKPLSNPSTGLITEHVIKWCKTFFFFVIFFSILRHQSVHSREWWYGRSRNFILFILYGIWVDTQKWFVLA